MKAKDIDSIVIHCTATPEGKEYTVASIRAMHLRRGFSDIGYHYVIHLDGTVEQGRPLTRQGAHSNTPGLSGRAYNTHSIGVCYVGGLDKNLKPKDTRTPQQKQALRNLVAELCSKYTILEVLGHRDTSPDLDCDGQIEPHEYAKACPCFEVRDEFSNFLKTVVIKAKKK